MQADQHPYGTSGEEGREAKERISRLIGLAEALDQDGIECLPRYIDEIRRESAGVSGLDSEAQCLLLMARYHAMKDNYVEAVTLSGEALRQFEETADAIGSIKAIDMLGYAYGQLGRLDEALRYFLDGLALFDRSSFECAEAGVLKGNLLSNLASVYGDLGRYDEAIEVLQQVLEQTEKTGGAPHVVALSNLCEAYINKGNAMNAMVCNQRALVEIKDRGLGNMHLFLCHNNFGRLYELSGQREKAIASYTEALDAAIRISNRFSMASALVSIGSLELRSGSIGEAVAALEQALALAEEIQANELRRTICGLLVQAHEPMGDYEKAFLYAKKAADIGKNLETSEMERKLSNYFADLKIEQAKKDAEIHRLKNVELRQKTEELERKAWELEESYRNIKAISEIGQKITNTLDVELILNTIFESVNGLMDAGFFAIGIYDEVMGIVDYKIVVQNSRPRPLFQVSVDDGRSIASAVVRTGKELMLGNAEALFTENAASYSKPDDCEKPKSTICCPLLLVDRITGVILVQSCRQNAFTERNLETVKALASFIAIALNNSRQSGELKAKARELELASRTDPLTGLFNRRHLLEKIEEERVRYQRNTRPFSVIICDIDHFKKVNDVYGHDCGDAVLKAIAGLLGRLIRKQDCLGRWGGEEFLLLLPETAAEGATVLAEKLRKRVEEHEFVYVGLKLPITMTFGVAQYNNDYGIDACIVGADSALYKGKSNGRNCVVTF